MKLVAFTFGYYFFLKKNKQDKSFTVCWVIVDADHNLKRKFLMMKRPDSLNKLYRTRESTVLI